MKSHARHQLIHAKQGLAELANFDDDLLRTDNTSIMHNLIIRTMRDMRKYGAIQKVFSVQSMHGEQSVCFMNLCDKILKNIILLVMTDYKLQ